MTGEGTSIAEKLNRLGLTGGEAIPEPGSIAAIVMVGSQNSKGLVWWQHLATRSNVRHNNVMGNKIKIATKRTLASGIYGDDQRTWCF